MKNKKLLYLIAVIAVAIISYFTTEPSDNQSASIGGLQLTFVDVGQGDAVFIRTRDGETWLIDGGEDAVFDDGLLPFLNSQGVDKLDFAVATHYHSDHTGGIFQLLKSGKIKTLLLPDYTPDSKAKTGLLKNAEAQGTAVLDISSGDVLDTRDNDLQLLVLHPQKGGFSADNENSNSLVIQLDYLGTSALLTGDLEEDAEEVLMRRYDLEADILKLGHHGSSTSTSKDFLAEVNPTYGIISAGKDNRYGHPHFEVLDRLSDEDVMTYRTDLDGDITFVIDENGIKSITTETNY